jgi:hypothetical protein
MRFRTDVCFSGNLSIDNIDEHTGVIKNVVLAREGIAKGHGVHLDSTFIAKLVELGNDIEAGVKARFGHPNMCSDALGTYIGRFKNFRVIEDKAYADLHMDEVAKKSPKGDLYSYVFGMAKSNPDMFGNSIVFRAGESIVALMASDLVDTPAATESLFSEDLTASKVTEFLESNPEVEEILFNKPELIEQFLNRYENYKSKKNKMEKSFTEKVVDVLKTFGITKSEDTVELSEEVVETEVTETEEVAEEVVAETELSTEEVVEATEHIEEKFNAEKEALTVEFEEEKNHLEVQLSELNEKIEALSAEIAEKDAKIEELSATPTVVEGNEDANITGEEKKMSASAKVLQDFIRSNK